MAVKARNASRTRTRTLATVKSGSECWINGTKCVKVRSKTVMDSKGKVRTLPDYTEVKVVG